MYSHAEQLFIDARGGTVPNEAEWLEIKALLAAMEKANFPIDDPSSAPFISIMAFFFARAPKHVDIDAMVQAGMKSFGEGQSKLLESLQASLEIAQKPVIHLDVIDTFKTSLAAKIKEVITLTAVFFATTAVGLAGFLGWYVRGFFI